MSSDDGESDFEGFDEEDLNISIEKMENISSESVTESDIDISDISSENNLDFESEDDEDVIAGIENLTSEWSHTLHDVHVSDFAEETGPKHNLHPDAKPLEYFSLFLPQSFYETVAEETNRYADQKIALNGPDPLWHPTTPEEMRAYFCINIMFGVKQMPRIHHYWSPDPRFGDPYISSIMPKTRFLKINQYLHLRDTTNTPARNDPNYDPLFKVRPLIDLLLPRFRAVYVPGKNISIDEAMIGFKGRLFFKQYMPAKPTKWGIKVWELCEASTGYCANFEVYTGKSRDGNRQYGLGYDVIWKLSEPFHYQHRHLYYDRFFSSLVLAEHLSLVNTYMCSTIMPNRKGLPPAIKKKLKNKGDLIQIQKGNLLATAYKDNRQITFLSSSSQPAAPVQGQKPYVNIDYNNNMGGVDLSDQHRAYYPIGRAGKKWWRYILWFLINLSMVNAHIVFVKSYKQPPPRKGYDHLSFRVDVASELRAGFTSRKHSVGRKSKQVINEEIHPDTLPHHKVVKIEGRKKVCRMCSASGRKTVKGYQIQTSYQCSFCNVPLCKGCFGQYHDRH